MPYRKCLAVIIELTKKWQSDIVPDLWIQISQELVYQVWEVKQYAEMEWSINMWETGRWVLNNIYL